MALKFSANISTMFTELGLKDRFGKAKDYGFNTVEIQNPYELSPEILGSGLQGMKCDLINIYGGANGFGCASIPLKEEEFCMATQKALYYYNVLNFKKLHILSGEKTPNYAQDDQLLTFIQSLNSLVEGDYLENINVVGLIEPICKEVNPNYFLDSFETAVEIVKRVNSEHVKLLLDVYHLHKITNNVHRYLEVYYPYAGHIQVSQDPGRREPFFDGGNIDYTYVFDFLRQRKHSDYIGLEYYPSDSTKKGFEWMKKFTG